MGSTPDLARIGAIMIGMGLMAGPWALAGDRAGGTATEPAPRTGAWMDLHKSYIERARKGSIDLLFLGDSITQGWAENDVWKRHYAPRNAANFGIGGDRTQHLLWRIENGELDGLTPRAVVL